MLVCGHPARQGVLPEVSGCRAASLSEALAGDSWVERGGGSEEIEAARESRPRGQGPYRRPGLARLCQARPREAGSRPSSPGRTSGRFCASWPSRPRCGFDPMSPAWRGPREMRLRSSGGSPPSSTEARDHGPKHRGARRGRPSRGRPACLALFPPGLAAGADRASRPLFLSKRTRKAKGHAPEPSGCGDIGACRDMRILP
jgi:hypothetical protein